jgi:L-fucose isomerase-like protein
MKMIDKKLSLGVIVGTRGFFNAELVAGVRRSLLLQIEKAGYEAVVLPEDATPNGAVESLADADKYAALFRSRIGDIDGLVVSLPNFGDELGIIETIMRSKLDVPILVHAEDDDIDKVDVASRRDAFCGKISVCNNFYQYSIPFTDTTNHTSKVDGDEFAADLDRFGRICRVVGGLSGARIGAIGARPAAFQTVRFSEKILQDSGITVVPVDLSEIIKGAEKLGNDDADVKVMLEKIRSYGTIPAEILETQVAKQAKLSVIINRWMAENQCDASAIQCWTSIEENYGCATCLSMSMMGEDLMPSACEVDITGALSMYTLALASGNAPGFLDWNNNYGSDPDKCVNTHCSNFPKSFMGRDVEISELDILGQTIGKSNCFGAVKGHVAPGDMTYFRLSTDDTLGMVSGYLGEGEFTDDPFPMDGGIAVCKVDGLRRLLRYITKNGFEHHVAMVRGRYAGLIEEAIDSYFAWDLYTHNG